MGSYRFFIVGIAAALVHQHRPHPTESGRYCLCTRTLDRKRAANTGIRIPCCRLLLGAIGPVCNLVGQLNETR